MTLRLRYCTLKRRALCWVLRRLRAGRGWLARLERAQAEALDLPLFLWRWLPVLDLAREDIDH